MVIEYDCPVPGWWFGWADPDGRVRLRHGDGRVVQPGETLSVLRPVVLYERGLHAGRDLAAALEYGTGFWLARVVLHPPVFFDTDTHIMASTTRTTLWMADMSRPLNEFALSVAEWLLCREWDAGREVPSRAWAALAAKRQYLARAIDWQVMEKARLALYQRDEPAAMAWPVTWPDDIAASALAYSGAVSARTILGTVRFGLGASRLTPGDVALVEARLQAVVAAAGAPMDDSAVLDQVMPL